MAVSQESEMAGSVSSGCVEGEVVQEALQVLKIGYTVVVPYSISDEQAFSVGLPCGGMIDILIRPYSREDLADIIAHLSLGCFFYPSLHRISRGLRVLIISSLR